MTRNPIGQPEGFVLTPVQPGAYTGEKDKPSQPWGIGQPAEGFVTDIMTEQSKKLEESRRTIPQPTLVNAEASLVVEQQVVAQHNVETGMNGNIKPLLEATDAVVVAREAENQILAAEQRSQLAEANLRSSDAAVDEYRAENGGQNGDLTSLINASRLARETREELKK